MSFVTALAVTKDITMITLKKLVRNVSAHFLETPASIPYLDSLFIIYWIATTPLREVNKIHFNPKKRGL